ncbi:HAD family hydrolase [Anaerolactibacter massiliensis]|uniref:HAD family hydrolase n=1 Tax=Anaerolactibacter massiliensis TaxID=2044573 RepID=UPI000CF86818|nr:HAD hydrolase-like protein [Anaerolactibacter massiliensis]
MKTLIWDYNGTILDDLDLCLKIENEMLMERHMKAGYTREQYRSLFCFPVIEYYYKLGYTFEHESYEQISVEFNERYDEGFSSCRLTDGFLEKIAEAEEKGYQNVILSACQEEKLLKQTEQLGIAGYFRERMGMDNMLAESKVEMAKHWMIRSGVNPDECMYIGDTLHDMETAKAIGIRNYVLVACGHQSYEVLRNASDHAVHNLREVVL